MNITSDAISTPSSTSSNGTSTGSPSSTSINGTSTSSAASTSQIDHGGNPIALKVGLGVGIGLGLPLLLLVAGLCGWKIIRRRRSPYTRQEQMSTNPTSGMRTDLTNAEIGLNSHHESNRLFQKDHASKRPFELDTGEGRVHEVNGEPERAELSGERRW